MGNPASDLLAWAKGGRGRFVGRSAKKKLERADRRSPHAATTRQQKDATEKITKPPRDRGGFARPTTRQVPLLLLLQRRRLCSRPAAGRSMDGSSENRQRSVADDVMAVDDSEDGSLASLLLPSLPLDVLAYVCSFLTTYELARLMATSTEMASVVLALGVSKPTRDLPTCPTEGPLRGIYISQYMDASGRPCHRAWRAVHPVSEPARRLYARRVAPLGLPAMLPLSVPRGAWCLPRPPFVQLGADLAMCFALVGTERMRASLPIAASILSEPLPPGTLVSVPGDPHVYPVASYADVFRHMERMEAAHAARTRAASRLDQWRHRFCAQEAFAGPTGVAARADRAGNVIIRLSQSLDQ
ncbi:hypothetical protein psal_cds_478 [Pandoravirus salinus]|uniref:F-box domain-containing protein n=1 Tax=Pandoravirus salinus TaxID=1349410 RepID=S4W1E5_9VIRU|nr:hypothetical protein psal_cds_478 [Pandoravirus salinus]AGO84252.2 hypothetical protein psal_cds_478 [Pandoravirus salinus]